MSTFLYQDADVIPLADKRIVVKSFVCMTYDKVLVETGKVSDNLRPSIPQSYINYVASKSSITKQVYNLVNTRG